ncbi:hypothetical protein BLIN101_01306 [Brevibacterium linens]|uniref:Uncharacterized protein n=2 Tax=Brevibacterium linens TaxID=1703 RepID=A0A2H1IKW2_BRELN|nr:hypothetical protein BLIN101_01306 [Brevibacterium linens]
MPQSAEDLRRLAFSAAATYRLRYPSADAVTVAEALRIQLPSLRHRPKLVAAAASRPTPDPQSVAVTALTRLRSHLLASDPPAREVQRLAAVVVQHFRAATEGESGGSVAFSSVLVSQSRCAWWWGVTPAYAGRLIAGYLGSGTLRLVGWSGRTRRVALAVGNPGRTEESDVWLDPAHPVWSAVKAAYADRTAQAAWAEAVVHDDLNFPLRFDSTSMNRAEAAYRERADASRVSILAYEEEKAADARVRRIVSGMPRRGAAHHKLEGWLRAALGRAAGSQITDADRDRLVAAIMARGHSETVAVGVAKKIIAASAGGR